MKLRVIAPALLLALGTAAAPNVRAADVCEDYNSTGYDLASYDDGGTGGWLGSMLGGIIFGCR